MKNNNRSNRQTPRNPQEPDDSLKILNLGLCIETSCRDQEPNQDHYHGLAYSKGYSTPELIAQAEKSLRAIGFSGSLEIEYISLPEWKKRASGHGEWL